MGAPQRTRHLLLLLLLDMELERLSKPRVVSGDVGRGVDRDPGSLVVIAGGCWRISRPDRLLLAGGCGRGRTRRTGGNVRENVVVASGTGDRRRLGPRRRW